jgi:hypothetical protein
VRALSTALVAALGLLLGPLSGEAHAYAARLRWQPSTDPTVGGYRIYRRPLGGWYGAAENVGIPPADGAGTLSHVITGLDASTDYAFAVTAYSTDGTESGFSNELILRAPARGCGADADCADDNACTTNERCEAGTCADDDAVCADPGPCAQATCEPAAGCTVAPLPDGSPCDAGDPCLPAVCTAGTCEAVAAAAGVRRPRLVVRRFALKRVGQRGRVVAQASFPTPAGLDPAATGIVIEVRGGDGVALYTADVPGRALRPNRSRRAFRYAGARGQRAPAEAAGLERLTVAIDGSITDVSLRATSPAMAAALGEARLLWALRFGAECLRDPDLQCGGGPSRISCQ